MCYGIVIATTCWRYASRNYLLIQKFYRYICLKQFKIRKKSKESKKIEKLNQTEELAERDLNV